MKIDFSQTDLSNHKAIQLAALYEEFVAAYVHADGFDPILPIDGGKRAYTIEKKGDGTLIAHLENEHATIRSTPVDYGQEGKFAFDYRYNNAQAQDVDGMAILEGNMTPLLHALILTVTASTGEDWCFIPFQLGLEDLQFSISGEPDFAGDDHVWHRPIGLYSIETKSSAHLSLTDLEEKCREVLRVGWDDLGAAEALSS